MSFIPELNHASSPSRRFSPTTLRPPSRSVPVPRGTNDTPSVNPIPTLTSEKHPYDEEHLNNLPEDPEQTVIHSPQTHTPPHPQSPEMIAGRAGSRTSLRGNGGRDWGGQLGSGSTRRGSGSTSPDRTIMPSSSTRGSGSGNSERVVPALALSKGDNDIAESEPVTPTKEEEEVGGDVSRDDLLIQLPDYNWSGFVSRFFGALKEVGAEKEKLSLEHDMWNWMYEIWSSSRDRDDTRWLSREMATLVQWTKLKEADLEHAREAHTQSMLAISSVLGIAPEGATPPPGVVNKRIHR